MEGKDRRRYPRFEGEFQVDLLNMGDDPGISAFEAIVAGTALDVSREGMRLKVSYNVAVGSVLSAIVYYAGSDSICLCDVVWKREVMGEYIYGLFIKEWSKLDPALDKKLAAMEEAKSIPDTPPTGTAVNTSTAFA